MNEKLKPDLPLGQIGIYIISKDGDSDFYGFSDKNKLKEYIQNNMGFNDWAMAYTMLPDKEERNVLVVLNGGGREDFGEFY